MKKCPRCQADYFDEQLEFCLEDGAKLTFARSTATAAETRVFDTAQNSVATAFFDRQRAEVPNPIDAGVAATINASATDATKTLSLRQNAVETGSRALEIGTLVIALANNWLQWLYIERQNYGTLTNFLFSVEFLFWLLLLFAGAAAGLVTLKLSRTKTLAYVGLVILAINFVLLLVPKK